MFALSSLVLTTLLLSSAARAGHWEFTCTGSGSTTHNLGSGPVTQPWPVPTGSGPGGQGPGVYYIIPAFGYGPSSSSAAGVTVSAAADISAVITMTWTHGSGQTDANDPVPPSVWLSESGSAQWTAQASSQDGSRKTGTGSANDGIGDGPMDVIAANGLKSGQLSSSANAPPGTPGIHLFNKSTSGNTITLSRTFHADASVTVGPPVNGGPGGYTMGAVIGQYTLSIHATPYNLRHSNFPGGPSGIQGGPGDLYWHYSWSSTSGNVTDLTGQDIHENLTFSGSTDDPPFRWQPPPFHSLTVPAKNGDMADDNTYGAHQGDTAAQSFVKNYKASRFSTNQSFTYYDPATMALNDEPIPLSIGPFR